MCHVLNSESESRILILKTELQKTTDKKQLSYPRIYSKDVQKHIPRRIPVNFIQHRQQASSDMGGEGERLSWAYRSEPKLLCFIITVIFALYKQLTKCMFFSYLLYFAMKFTQSVPHRIRGRNLLGFIFSFFIQLLMFFLQNS